jgi:manganese/zinc/iron transport system substrate-binding protein
LSWAILGLLWGCGSDSSDSSMSKRRQWMVPNDKIKVLTTISMIQDIVQQIGGEHVEVLSLITGELDPHSYQLVKGDGELLAFADLIIYNGLGLEHGPSLQKFLLGNSKAIAVGDQIMRTSPELFIVTQSQIDPHIWMDISLWNRIIPIVVEALTAKDPSHAKDFEENGLAVQKKMLAAHESIRSQMERIPSEKRYLVTSHDSFHYFTKAYLTDNQELETEAWRSRCAAPEGLSPESELSTSDIHHIIEHLQKYTVRVVFTESNVSRDSIRKIVAIGKEKGFSIQIAKDCLYADSMGHANGKELDYLGMIQHNASVIAGHLEASE